jgi:hypothetical protein
MKVTKPIHFLIILFVTNISLAQLADLTRVDYTFIPNDGSDVEYTRFRALFNYPVKLKNEGEYLLLGLDYSSIHLRIESNSFPFNKRDLNDFKLLDLNIGYTKPLKNDWRFGIRLKPGFSTNLTANELSFEDIVFSGDLVFIRDRKENNFNKKPNRLILGVSFSENRGYPFPLPFISYYRKFHSKWSYNVGIPKMNLQYHYTDKNRFKVYAELDGFTANLQNGLLINNTEIAESVNMSLILGGLQYEYHFLDHFEFFARSSYIISNSVKLRDTKKNSIMSLDNSNSTYLQTGIRLKI